MAIDVMDLVKGYLTPNVIQTAATRVGESSDATQKALLGIVPTLVGALANTASTNEGTQQRSNEMSVVKRSLAGTIVLGIIGLLVGCRTAPTTTEQRDELTRKVTAEQGEWNKLDPGMAEFAKTSYGFAFFPEITKGGLVVGGGYGRGVVYEHGTPVGYAEVTQGSFGLQAGGQTYSEMIVFENQAAMERFKQNKIDFGANASAIIAKTGAATNARFVDGVAVFVRPLAGAMAEASLAGQRITYVPK